jgi:hypothetical protein
MPKRSTGFSMQIAKAKERLAALLKTNVRQESRD